MATTADAVRLFGWHIPTHGQLRHYLVSRGWKLDRHYGASSIWRHPSQAAPVDEVYLPPDSPTWPPAVERAAAAIARAEGRRIEDVARDLKVS